MEGSSVATKQLPPSGNAWQGILRLDFTSCTAVAWSTVTTSVRDHDKGLNTTTSAAGAMAPNFHHPRREHPPRRRVRLARERPLHFPLFDRLLSGRGRHAARRAPG